MRPGKRRFPGFLSRTQFSPWQTTNVQGTGNSRSKAAAPNTRESATFPIGRRCPMAYAWLAHSPHHQPICNTVCALYQASAFRSNRNEPQQVKIESRQATHRNGLRRTVGPRNVFDRESLSSRPKHRCGRPDINSHTRIDVPKREAGGPSNFPPPASGESSTSAP